MSDNIIDIDREEEMERNRALLEEFMSNNGIKMFGLTDIVEKKKRSFLDFIRKENPYHDPETGRFTNAPGGTGSSSNGNGSSKGSGWSKTLNAEKQKVLAMKPNNQALYILDNGGETYDNCVAAMKNGQTEALVNNYFAIMEANGDPTPTKPTISEQLNWDLKDDVDSGLYDDYTEARIDYIKKMTGQNDASAKATYSEMETWFGSSWDSADTATLDSYIASDHVYDGTIYRGMSFSNEDYASFMKNISPGSTISMLRNSSWTSSKDVALDYSHRGDDGVNSITIECVKNRTSAPVSHLSYQGEDEILASSTAKWTVLHQETYQTSKGSYKTHITVVEAGENE